MLESEHREGLIGYCLCQLPAIKQICQSLKLLIISKFFSIEAVYTNKAEKILDNTKMWNCPKFVDGLLTFNVFSFPKN